MNSQRTALGNEVLKGSFARRDFRDPANPDLARDHPLVRIMDGLRSVLMWGMVFAIAASGAFLVGNLMPELNAAVPSKAIAIAATTRSDAPVCDVGD